MAKPLLIYFREERQFDRQLWMNYFTLGVTFLSQPDLQFERMGELASLRAQGCHSIDIMGFCNIFAHFWGNL